MAFKSLTNNGLCAIILTMKIERTSGMSGITRTLDLPVTQEQLDAWQDGELIQRAMPHLTADEREFLMTGITADEWEKMFSNGRTNEADEEAFAE